MKKILFILLAMLPAMIFTACSDDNDNAINSPIVGNWKANDVDKTIETSFNGDGRCTTRITYPDGSVAEERGSYRLQDADLIIEGIEEREKTAGSSTWTEWVTVEQPYTYRYSISASRLIYHIPAAMGENRDVVFLRQ